MWAKGKNTEGEMRKRDNVQCLPHVVVLPVFVADSLESEFTLWASYYSLVQTKVVV